MLKGTYFLFSVMACVAQSTATASAQIAAFDERRIQAAVMLDGFAEPIAGSIISARSFLVQDQASKWMLPGVAGGQSSLQI